MAAVPGRLAGPRPRGAPVRAIMGPMRRRVFGGRLIAVVVMTAAVLGSLLTWAVPARAAGFAVRRQADLLAGVQVQSLGSSSLSLDVGRVARGAAVRVEAVTAGAVGGGVETTSAVCRRVGGIVCVNADFSECRTCTTAFGGVVHDNVMQRSPVPGHGQLWLGPAGPGAGARGWGGSLEATVTYGTSPPPILGLVAAPPTERVETVSLPLDAVNRARGPNQVVLFTPPWGANTATPGGGDEAVIAGGAATLGTDLGVDLRSLAGNAGSTPIPGDGMVVSSQGAGAARLRAFWAKASDPAAARRSVVLRTSVDKPAEESVGGHPVILANGQEVIGGSTDPFATGRNPRTLVGWNGAGDLLLVTVDGRQPGRSVGVSLVEAADVLRQLGATSGFNLDGGGSTTFVSLPPGGRTPLVLNRPSDGTERRITTVLAVVPVDRDAVRISGSPSAAPPQPPPAPPGPPPVDEASTDGLPARPRRAPVPTTSTTAPAPPPPTVAPTPDVVPPVPDTAPAEAAAFQLAAPSPAPLPPKSSGPSTAVPGGIAAAALAAAAAATALTARRRRRPSGRPVPPA